MNTDLPPPACPRSSRLPFALFPILAPICALPWRSAKRGLGGFYCTNNPDVAEFEKLIEVESQEE